MAHFGPHLFKHASSFGTLAKGTLAEHVSHGAHASPVFQGGAQRPLASALPGRHIAWHADADRKARADPGTKRGGTSRAALSSKWRAAAVTVP